MGKPAGATRFRCEAGHELWKVSDETEIDCLECGDQDNSCDDEDCCGGPWPYYPSMERQPNISGDAPQPKSSSPTEGER